MTVERNPPRISTLQNENLVDDKKQSHGHEDDEEDEKPDHGLVVVCKMKLEDVRVTDA